MPTVNFEEHDVSDIQGDGEEENEEGESAVSAVKDSTAIGKIILETPPSHAEMLLLGTKHDINIRSICYKTEGSSCMDNTNLT